MFLLVPTGCTDPCENVVLNELTVPGGELAAISYLRKCGATAADYTEVSLLKRGAKPINAGNIASFNWRLAKPELVGAKGEVKLHIRWLSKRQLEIKYSKYALLSSVPKTSFKDIKIRYLWLEGNNSER